jgi:hypothetical protein
MYNKENVDRMTPMDAGYIILYSPTIPDVKRYSD